MKAVQIYKDSFSSFLEDKFRLLRASPRVPNKASQFMIFGKNRKIPISMSSQSYLPTFGTWKKSPNAWIYLRVFHVHIGLPI